jgi:hypothetical protein
LAVLALGVGVAAAAPGTTERVSVSSSEAQSDGISGRRSEPALTGDGSVVAFDSLASNLVMGDSNGVDDVFVRDRVAGTTERVNVASDGAQANGENDGPGLRGGVAFGPDISDDGRFVAFNTCGLTLVDPPSICPDIFRRDRQTGTTIRVSVDSASAQANHASTDPAISGNGRVVGFFSLASNLVAGDTNTARWASSASPTAIAPTSSSTGNEG